MSKEITLSKTEIKTQFLDAMNFRHATKEYDSEKKISDEDFNYILEAGRLSPSSLGSEPWKFIVIQNPTLREKLLDVAPGAVEKLKTASHFVVIASRKNVRHDSEYLLNHMKNVQYYPEDILENVSTQYRYFQESRNILESERSLNDWAAKQTYIALGNMLTAAAMIGIDSTPMEGFQDGNLDAVLNEAGLLEDGVYSASVLGAFGYRKADPTRPKTRRAIEDVVEWA